MDGRAKRSNGANGPVSPRVDLESMVSEVFAATPFIDVHTHLFAPEFGPLGLWGIDDLLTYHYLEAEFFRFSTVQPCEYWALSKSKQADLIWKTLFVENTPLSEATRGVIAILDALNLDTAPDTLRPLREFFRDQNLADYVPRVFRLAGISAVVMTNDPLDPAEAAHWAADIEPDPRFHSALRLDRILNDFETHCGKIASRGYAVDRDVQGRTLAEVRRFVVDCATRMHAVYMAVSLPDSFVFPDDDLRTQLLTGAILPACRDLEIPLVLMIGVRRQVNPALRLAGDAVGRADMRSLEAMCRDFPENRFLVSVLSRENQHELCVYARKFNNLMPFGCWWFLNNPSIVEEITRERFEMLGASFIPQHSDARILEQVIYKWRNTRRTLAPVIAKACELLTEDGRLVTRDDVQAVVTRLFRTNFEQWTSGSAVPTPLHVSG
jgi:hypothetical protein